MASSAPTDDSPFRGRGRAPLPEGWVIEKVAVEADKIGVVIGREGKTIKGIAERTNTQINSRDGSFTIKGLPEDVEAAKTEISTVIAGASAPRSPGGRVGGGGGFGSALPEGHVKDTVTVDASYVGVVIGREGRTVKDLSARTGAQVNSNRDGTFTIKGLPAAVAAAKEEIASIVAAAASRASGGGSPALPPGSVTTTYKVADESQVKFIIGKGGRNIKDLQAATHTRISSKDGVFTVTGTQDNVNAALAEIEAQATAPRAGFDAK